MSELADLPDWETIQSDPEFTALPKEGQLGVLDAWSNHLGETLKAAGATPEHLSDFTTYVADRQIAINHSGETKGAVNELSPRRQGIVESVNAEIANGCPSGEDCGKFANRMFRQGGVPATGKDDWTNPGTPYFSRIYGENIGQLDLSAIKPGDWVIYHNGNSSDRAGMHSGIVLKIDPETGQADVGSGTSGRAPHVSKANFNRQPIQRLMSPEDGQAQPPVTQDGFSTLDFTADATNYMPASSAAIEGGPVGAGSWHGQTLPEQEPLHTLDQYRRGESPYVSVAMDNTHENPLAYGTMLSSPDIPGVPFRVMDTGGAFNGKNPKYGGPKGLSRIDIARDVANAKDPETNRPIRFTLGAPSGKAIYDGGATDIPAEQQAAGAEASGTVPPDQSQASGEAGIGFTAGRTITPATPEQQAEGESGIETGLATLNYLSAIQGYGDAATREKARADVANDAPPSRAMLDSAQGTLGGIGSLDPTVDQFHDHPLLADFRDIGAATQAIQRRFTDSNILGTTVGGGIVGAAAMALAPETGGLSLLALGLGGAYLGGEAGGATQDQARRVTETPEKTDAREQQLAIDEQNHPYAVKAADIGAAALLFRPSPTALANSARGLGYIRYGLPLPAAEKAALQNTLLAAGIGATQTLGLHAATGQPIKVEDVLDGAVTMAFLNHPTPLGRALGYAIHEAPRPREAIKPASEVATEEPPTQPAPAKPPPIPPKEAPPSAPPADVLTAEAPKLQAAGMSETAKAASEPPPAVEPPPESKPATAPAEGAPTVAPVAHGEFPKEGYTAAPGALPKLRPGENQGDLMATQTEDFRLVGESAVDTARLAKEKAARAKEADDARKNFEREQQQLFEEHVAGGHELLDAVRNAGGLPSIKNDPSLTGETRRIWESGNKGRVLRIVNRQQKLSLDGLRQTLEQYGFRFDTPHEMLSAIEDRLASGKPQYGFEPALEGELASTKRKTKVAPAANDRSTAITDAYRKLAEKTGYPDVRIAELQQESGAPLEEVQSFLKEQWKKGKAHLSGGEPSFYTPEQRAAHVEVHGDKMFLARLPEEAPPEELSRTRGRAKASDAFERAQTGDDTAFDEMDAAFRERFPQQQSTESELGAQPKVFTPGAFARLFDVAFAAKDFDAILDAVKVSDKGVWVPLLKKFFAEQADDPVAASKADWMRHIFNGTRPPDAKAPAAAPPPRAASTAPPTPPRASAPPPRASAPPPPHSATPPAPPPRIPVNPITGGEAKSPFKIIDDFSKEIGKSLRVRRHKPSQLGTYRPGSTRVAERFAGDLDTAAHELAGHWTDDRYGIGAPWMRPRQVSPYDAELEKFWIHGSPARTLKLKRAEGIAEYVRAYVMDPAAATAQAPTFSAYFERTIPPEALKALNNFSNDVRTWAGEQPLRRSALNVATLATPTLSQKLHSAIFGDSREFKKTFLDKLRWGFDDSYHYAVKGWVTALEMRGKTPDTVDPSENFDLMLRVLSSHDARLSDQLENGLYPLRPDQAPNAKGEEEVVRLKDPQTGEPMTLEWLVEPFDNSSNKAQERDMREASGMMVAQRTLEKATIIDQAAADEISALDPADPTSPAKANRIRAQAEADKENISGLGAGMMSDVEAARQTMADLSSDPNRARRLQEAARRYRLWADSNLDYLVDAGRISKERADTIRSENTQYVDMHRLSEDFEEQSHRAAAKRLTAGKPLEKFKGSTLEIENVYKSLLSQTDRIQKEALRNQTFETFTDALESSRKLYEGDPVELDKIGSRSTADDPNSIPVWKNGEPIHWKLDKDIHEAVKGLGELGSHPFVDFFAKGVEPVRYLITRSLGFMLRNPLRDAIEQSVTSEVGHKPWDILKGYSKSEKSRLEAFGGGQFGNYARNRTVWNKELKRALRALSKDPRNIIHIPAEAKRKFDALAGASETIGRVAEFRRAYKKGIERGYSKYDAALFASSEARGLMDFAKAGAIMRQINRLSPFSNAHLRGEMKIIRTASRTPGAFTLNTLLYVVAPTLTIMAWNRSRSKDEWEEYQQLPAYRRDFFWNIKAGHHWITIPKPHELGVLASGVERVITRWAFGEKNAMDGYGGSVASSLSPISTVADAAGPMKVPMEIFFNRDTFRDRDIVNSWEKDLKLELRTGTEHASEPGKILGDIFQADPRYVDHALRSLGGLGQALVNFTNKEMPAGQSALQFTGLVGSTPATQSADYQWVMDWAKQNGKTQSHAVKALHAMGQEVYKAKSAEEVDKAAKALRERASEVRTEIEKASSEIDTALLSKAKAKKKRLLESLK